MIAMILSQETRVKAAVKYGLDYIRTAQSRSGGFTHLSSGKKNDFLDARTYSTVFVAANILNCLNETQKAVPEIIAEIPEFEAARKGIADFLLAQRSEHWSFNYWANGTEERKTLPYPDDLDDTFVALTALAGYDKNLVDGAVIAAAMKILTTVEAREGGPYRTWLVSKGSSEKWHDVDLAVNANVARFLAHFDVNLPNLTAFIDEKIMSDDIASPYYPSAVPVLYFIAQSYAGKHKEKLADIMLLHLTKCANERNCENILEIAMLVSSLIDLGYAGKISERYAGILIEESQASGFQPHAFCMDPTSAGQKQYAGSAVLTAAFCVEAMAKYVAAQNFVAEIAEPDSDYAPILELIQRQAIEKAQSLPENLRRIARGEIQKIHDIEIVALPFRVRDALGNRAAGIRSEILESLSLANLYGWIAYDIYDDFLDDEGEPLALSAGNYFLREITMIYATLEAEIPGISHIYRKYMNIIDDANVWEKERCRFEIEGAGGMRFPRKLPYVTIENLADRSIAHAMSAIAIFMLAGFAPPSHESENLVAFFRHFLIARQLHDDARDWLDDLSRGRINAVGAQVIREWKGNIAWPQNSFEIAEVAPELRKIFRQSVAERVVDDILFHLAAARRMMRAIPIFGNSDTLEALLEPLARAAEGIRTEQNNIAKFRSVYFSK